MILPALSSEVELFSAKYLAPLAYIATVEKSLIIVPDVDKLLLLLSPKCLISLSFNSLPIVLTLPSTIIGWLLEPTIVGGCILAAGATTFIDFGNLWGLSSTRVSCRFLDGGIWASDTCGCLCDDEIQEKVCDDDFVGMYNWLFVALHLGSIDVRVASNGSV